MKKIISVILCLTLFTLIFAACGSAPAEETTAPSIGSETENDETGIVPGESQDATEGETKADDAAEISETVPDSAEAETTGASTETAPVTEKENAPVTAAEDGTAAESEATTIVLSDPKAETVPETKATTAKASVSASKESADTETTKGKTTVKKEYNSSGDFLMAENEYNTAGQLVSRKDYLYNEADVAEYYTITYYEPNSDGKRIVKTETYHQDGKLEDFSLYRYSGDTVTITNHNAKGVVTGSEIRKDFDSKGNYYSECYDAKGNLITKCKYNAEGYPIDENGERLD